jgi:hypothetical protein
MEPDVEALMILMHERRERVQGWLFVPGIEVTFPEDSLELDVVELAVEIEGQRRIVIQMKRNGVHAAETPAL